MIKLLIKIAMYVKTPVAPAASCSMFDKTCFESGPIMHFIFFRQSLFCFNVTRPVNDVVNISDAGYTRII